MPHTKADYTLADAVAGGRLVYKKLAGETVGNAAFFYASTDVLGYGGTFIPEGAAPAAAKKAGKKLTQAEAKKKLIAALKPIAEPASLGAEAAAAGFDWSKIAALLLQILPFILPLLQEK